MRSTVGFLLLLLALPCAGQVYKWVDSQGKAHYGDSPPDDVKKEQLKVEVRSHEGPAQVTDWAAILRRATPPTGRIHAVTVYTAVWCGPFKRAKSYLNAQGVRFNEVDVETADGKREFAQMGGGGIPLILVGSKAMRGFDEARLAAMLKGAR